MSAALNDIIVIKLSNSKKIVPPAEWGLGGSQQRAVLCSLFSSSPGGAGRTPLAAAAPTTVRVAQLSLRPTATEGEQALTPASQHPLPLRPAGSGAQVAPSVRPLDECPKARNMRFHHQRCVPLQIKNVLASVDVSELSQERSSSCPCGEGTCASITHPTLAGVAEVTPPPRTEAHHGAAQARRMRSATEPAGARGACAAQPWHEQPRSRGVR